MFGACASADRDAVQWRAADHHALRAERKQLHDIAAAPHAPVGQNRQTRADCVNHARKSARRRYGKIQVPTAVV